MTSRIRADEECDATDGDNPKDPLDSTAAGKIKII